MVYTLCHSLHTLHHSTTSLPVIICYSLQHSLLLSVSSCNTTCYYLSLLSSLCHSQHSLQHSLSLSVPPCSPCQQLHSYLTSSQDSSWFVQTCKKRAILTFISLWIHCTVLHLGTFVPRSTALQKTALGPMTPTTIRVIGLASPQEVGPPKGYPKEYP